MGFFTPQGFIEGSGFYLISLSGESGFLLPRSESERGVGFFTPQEWISLSGSGFYSPGVRVRGEWVSSLPRSGFH